MYYTTSGSYRKSNMIIDYINIGLTVAIGVMFILILFFRSRSGMLFPAVFLAGGLLNGLSAMKSFMDRSRIAGCFLAIIAIALLVLAAITYQVVK